MKRYSPILTCFLLLTSCGEGVNDLTSVVEAGSEEQEDTGQQEGGEIPDSDIANTDKPTTGPLSPVTPDPLQLADLTCTSDRSIQAPGQSISVICQVANTISDGYILKASGCLENDDLRLDEAFSFPMPASDCNLSLQIEGPSLKTAAIALPQKIPPQAIYVDPSSGSDTNDGFTVNSPIKTLSHLNSLNVQPGTWILLENSTAHTDTCLELARGEANDNSNHVLITSYGAGPEAATIAPTTDICALYVNETAGITIRNLILEGSFPTTATNTGLVAHTSSIADEKHNGLVIEDVAVSGFKMGISVGGWNDAAGFSDVLINRAKAYNNRENGIWVYGEARYANQDIILSNIQAYDNHGISGSSTPSGSGIVLSSVSNGTIKDSLAYNNGTTGNGGVGMWTYDSENIVIERNISHSNKTSGTADGGGFDLDGAVKNSIMQYNLSYDNMGAGYLVGHYSGAPGSVTNNIIRFNVTINDGTANNYGSITLFNATSDNSKLNKIAIYNNLVYKEDLSNALVKSTHHLQDIYIFNNLLVSKSTAVLNPLKIVEFSEASTATTMAFNHYDLIYNVSSNLRFTDGAMYNSLLNWSDGTGQEKYAAQPVYSVGAVSSAGILVGGIDNYDYTGYADFLTAGLGENMGNVQGVLPSTFISSWNGPELDLMYDLFGNLLDSNTYPTGP